MYDVEPIALSERRLTKNKLNNICQILYGPFIMVTKASILLLLARIFAPQRRGLIYVMVHLLIWLNLVFYGAVTIVKIVQCIPRARIWDSSVTGTCIDLTAVLKTTGIFNTASDLFILVLPIREIWKLKMEIRQKLGVSAAFAVGLVYVQSLHSCIPSPYLNLWIVL